MRFGFYSSVSLSTVVIMSPTMLSKKAFGISMEAEDEDLKLFAQTMGLTDFSDDQLLKLA